MSGAPGVGKSAILQSVCQDEAGDNKLDPLLGQIEADNRYAIFASILLSPRQTLITSTLVLMPAFSLDGD